jgi:hypothetical protein
MTQKKKENELDPNTQLEKRTSTHPSIAAVRLPDSGRSLAQQTLGGRAGLALQEN